MQTNARSECVVTLYQCVRSDNVETLTIPSMRRYARSPSALIAFHSFFVWRGDFFEKVLAMGLRASFSLKREPDEKLMHYYIIL